MFKRLKIGTKILLVTVGMVVVVIIVSGLVSDLSTRDALQQDTFNKLTAVREMKAQQVEDYFEQIRNQVVTFSESRMVVDAMRDLNSALQILRTERMFDVTIDSSLNDLLGGIERRLKKYYRKELLAKLMPNLDVDEISGLTFSMGEYIPQDLTFQLLQDLYIASNPNPTGQKHRLDQADDGGAYSETHGVYHPLIRSYLEKFGYYDIFLVDSETGNIVYSVFKEVDFATSLLTGPYKNTNLARAFRAARDADDKDFIKVVDFEPYYPSYGARASFIASPIVESDRQIGVLVFQMPVDRINDIMTNKQSWSDVGLGETGETYIVGDDFTLRNQSRFLIEDPDNYFEMIADAGLSERTVNRIRNLNTSIGLQEVKTPGTKAALSGESNTEIFPDYRGVPVLSSYRPLNIRDVNWAIMSEIDRDEAFQVFDSLRDRTIMLASILLALTIYISYYFSLSLTRPLRFLEKAAGLLTAGKLDEPIKRETHDEIGDLAGNFEQMRVALRDTFAEVARKNTELEDRVAERTAELDHAVQAQADQNRTLEERNDELQTIQEKLVQSRQEIEASEERIKAIVQSSPDGIVSIDANGIIGMFSASAERIFGYSVDEVVGKNVKVLMPKQIAMEHDYYLGLFNPGSESKIVGQTRELEGRRKDGSLFPLELSVEMVHVGDEMFFVSLLRDISERKEVEAERKGAQEALAWEKEVLNTTLENMDQGISMIDNECRFVEFNKKYFEILDLPPDKFDVGVSIEEVYRFLAERGDYGPGDVEDLVRERVALTRKFESHQFERETHDGRTVEIRGLPTPMGGLVTTYTDITERKRNEGIIERRALEARLLHEATATATEAETLENSLRRCMNVICELLDWPVGHAYLPSSGNEKVLVSSDIWYLREEDTHREFKQVTGQTTFEKGVGLPGRIWEAGEPVWIIDVAEDPNFPRAKLCQDLSLHGAFGFPIIVAGDTVCRTRVL